MGCPDFKVHMHRIWGKSVQFTDASQVEKLRCIVQPVDQDNLKTGLGFTDPICVR